MSNLFQCCQKLVIFRNNDTEVLLARRKGEADYDGVYSLIGGKLDSEDGGLVAGLQREKNEEIGAGCELNVEVSYSWNAYFIKSDYTHMVLPHYYAEYIGGDITLSSEYSDYAWFKIDDLADQNIIPNIPEAAAQVLKFKKIAEDKDFVKI